MANHSTPPANAALISELEPLAGELVERHLTNAREWFPHEMVPWSRGRDFVADEEWTPPADGLDAPVRSALLVNILTEDNLPHYYRTISSIFGRDDAWGEWSRRWTAEEGRHAIVIRDYLTVTRAIDPWELERARMAQVTGGKVPEPYDVADVLVYVALQELATRISHRNTGKVLRDPAGFEIMARVAADENLHHLFYRDLVTAAIEVDPDAVVFGIEHQVLEFSMPGTGIADFAAHAKLIASAGIYDFKSHHDQILVPVVLRHWKLESIEGLSPEAEASRDRVLAYIARIGKIARRLSERREAADLSSVS